MAPQIRVSEKHKCAIIPYAPAVATMIPHCKELGHKGYKFLVVPSGKDEMQLLRNLGYQAPTDMVLNYDWNGIVPFDSQKVTANMMVHNKRAFILNEMGCGKTLSALFAFDYLKKNHLANRMIVVAPLSCVTTVWEREVFTRMPHLHCVSLWAPTAEKRIQRLKEPADIYVINHDGIGVILPELLARKDIDTVLIDELAVFRNKTTDRWKHANKLVTNATYSWGMTGSPTPKEPADAWAQVKLLRPGNVPRYYKEFRDMTMTQINQFRWIPKRDANETVFSVMQPCVRFTREDCLDLPETTYSTHEVPLTAIQNKAYKKMVAHSYVQFTSGAINAANAAVVTSKLLQISCGFGYDSTGRVIKIPAPGRVTELKDIIDECDHKLIVFVPYIAAVRMLFKELQTAGYDAAMVYGDTKKRERDQIFTDFQYSNKLKVLVAHPQTMAHGLTLTAANTIVWYSPSPSLEIYEQANARITRPSQVNKTHILHIQGSPIEKKIYNKLSNRADAQNVLLEMFADSTPHQLAI